MLTSNSFKQIRSLTNVFIPHATRFESPAALNKSCISNLDGNCRRARCMNQTIVVNIVCVVVPLAHQFCSYCDCVPVCVDCIYKLVSKALLVLPVILFWTLTNFIGYMYVMHTVGGYDERVVAMNVKNT